MQGKKGALHLKRMKLKGSVEQTQNMDRFQPISYKRDFTHTVSSMLVGSHVCYARKAGGLGPPPRFWSKLSRFFWARLPSLRHLGWLGGVPVRGALAAQNKMDF